MQGQVGCRVHWASTTNRKRRMISAATTERTSRAAFTATRVGTEDVTDGGEVRVDDEQSRKVKILERSLASWIVSYERCDGRNLVAAPEFGAFTLVVTFSGSKIAIQNICESLKSQISLCSQTVRTPKLKFIKLCYI
jgi:hypothetical protein